MIPTSSLRKPPDSIYEYLGMALDARWITNNGSLVRLLEQRLSVIHGTKHCIAMCSGFWAIALTLKTLGKGEVVMPTMTYRRLADIVSWAGMIPHFCDINSGLGADLSSIESSINKNTKALLIAQPIVKRCDMRGVELIGKRHAVPVIFDSVEAAYGTHEGRAIGSFGLAECFSLHASKLLNGFEGGYVTTNDDDLADELRALRCFGEGGMNAKLNEIHAAAALSALDGLQNNLEKNYTVYQAYRSLIDVIEYPDELCSFKNIMIEVENRDEVLKALHDNEYLARPYYPEPFHMKPLPYDSVSENCPIAERLCKRFLILPSGEFLKLTDIPRIVDVVCRTAKFPAIPESAGYAQKGGREAVLH